MKEADAVIAGCTEDTYISTVSLTNDVLDMAIMRNIRHQWKMIATDELSSDYLPVIIQYCKLN